MYKTMHTDNSLILQTGSVSIVILDALQSDWLTRNFTEPKTLLRSSLKELQKHFGCTKWVTSIQVITRILVKIAFIFVMPS